MTGSIRFLMIVSDPAIATYCATHGVDTLFVDLERHGKDERQRNLPSWISRQQPEDITRVREAAPAADLLVRLNPLHGASAAEIEDALARGADRLMLPMFRSADEVTRFFDLVRARAPVMLLFETAAALAAMGDILARVPLGEAHIGLNDLHLDLGQRFMFEPLARGLLEEPCAALREAGVRFGIGGLARAGEGIVDPELLLSEHVRLGSTQAILSRTFHRNSQTLEEMRATTDFAAEIARLRDTYRRMQEADMTTLQRNRMSAADCILQAAAAMDERRVRT